MGRTFTESGRRAQIVRAAIEVVAELGYAKASFSRIAKQAGLSSTGMISYHFAGKDDLMHEVVAEVTRVTGAFMAPRVGAAEGARARLRVFIESNIELLALWPGHLKALIEVLPNLGGDDPATVGYQASMQALMEGQEQAVRAAQEAGEFREFDARLMLVALRGAIDAVVMRWVGDPDFDVAEAGRELADIFDRATRAES
ncbi:DNA-binding transcriptional regulator YbjK [Kitasatospora sp. Ki12]|uniref:TetR/AcrR family transcriptional regulator n=1 Tax=Kitasatospora xanthocidica TaxID=83382 RepID=UPI00167290A8|nr:TetR/AcrR family transcriptional regulator [Kitasatospora xanthocidica]GHF90226.1 TetR family transcriptional regulator [Kitasatospora xanthocidica]